MKCEYTGAFNMGKKLFIGSLSWNTDTDSLRQAFEPFGEITDVVVIGDRETGRSRGFGFVTFSDDNAASTAMEKLDGTDLDGRTIKVDLASERSGDGSSGGYGNR
jgi:cold-inducible RNA-binding protein